MVRVRVRVNFFSNAFSVVTFQHHNHSLEVLVFCSFSPSCAGQLGHHINRRSNVK